MVAPVPKQTSSIVAMVCLFEHLYASPKWSLTFLLNLFMFLQESEGAMDSQNVGGVSTDTFQPSLQVILYY